MTAIETMLISWKQTAHSRTITLQLPDDESLEPFKTMRVGRVSGQRLGIAFALIGDDESTQEIPKTLPSEERPNIDYKGTINLVQSLSNKPKREMTLSQYVGMLCNERDFIDFLKEKYPSPWKGYEENEKSFVGDTVRKICDVRSRSEIQYDTPAQQKWADLVNDYRDWLKS